MRFFIGLALGVWLCQWNHVPCDPMREFVIVPCPKPNPLVAGKRKPEAPKDLRVRLLLSPRVGLAPVEARVQIRVDDPKRELACPAWGLSWGDGSSSFWASTCDPYEFQEDRPTLYIEPREPRWHRYYIGGEYAIRGIVADAFQTRTAEATLLVSGPSLKDIR